MRVADKVPRSVRFAAPSAQVSLRAQGPTSGRHYGAPRSIFIRVLLDCADNFLVVRTLAVKSGLRPAKRPDTRAFFATVSLHTSTLHPSLLRRGCGAEESSGTEPKGGGRNESSELLGGGKVR